METQKKVEELLAGLGSTADKVAQSLRDRGIKGTGYGTQVCPIAKLVQRELGEADVSVGYEWISGARRDEPHWATIMPGAVQRFILNLKSTYKDLVQE